VRHTPPNPERSSRVAFSDLLCSACGRKVGRRAGTQVVLGLICDNPICDYQGETTINEERDSWIALAVAEGVPVSQVAFSTEISRQRIYQILDTWKQGI
jgi:hypothetical protein